LTRFKYWKVEKNIDLLVLISGPEPQRTAFENMVLLQMTKLSFKMVLVRGLPGAPNKIINTNKNLQIFDHLSALELSKLIQSSKTIIARSGYSTIMDLISLQQKAILIPTPGQTEQEYLSSYLSAKKYFVAAQQRRFNLIKELQNFKSVELKTLPAAENNKLQEAIICLK
jgi:UDP-N-acetylglucosamine transferase subunit ALG13